MKEKEIKKMVKGRYARIAKRDQQGCCPSCGSASVQAEAIGYSREDLEHIPGETIMGLGCGNPIAMADIKAGEVVLDLGREPG